MNFASERKAHASYEQGTGPMWWRPHEEERTMAKKAKARQTTATPAASPASPRSLMQRLAALQEEFEREVRQRDRAAEPQPDPQ